MKIVSSGSVNSTITTEKLKDGPNSVDLDMPSDSMNSTLPLTTEHVQDLLRPVRVTRNYTSNGEHGDWWYVKRWKKYYYGYGRNGPDWLFKTGFRSRRMHLGTAYSRRAQTLRVDVGNHEDIGAFLKLTNSYFLIGDQEESSKFCQDIEYDALNVPIIKTTIGGCRVIGRMCVGNKYGLILPETIYDTELKEIKENMPDSIKIQVVEEKLSALGNIIACNDRIAIVHPELDKNTEEIIQDTLQVDVFRHAIANKPTIGSYCVLNNEGGLICGDIEYNLVEDLSSLIGLRLIPGTVNGGKSIVAAGLVANDSIAYTGMKTTAQEIFAIEQAFSLPHYI